MSRVCPCAGDDWTLLRMLGRATLDINPAALLPALDRAACRGWAAPQNSDAVTAWIKLNNIRILSAICSISKVVTPSPRHDFRSRDNLV